MVLSINRLPYYALFFTLRKKMLAILCKHLWITLKFELNYLVLKEELHG